VVALCNSEEQRRLVATRAQARGFANLEVIRADVATWPGAGRFDRIVSIEMFEHLRNYELLFARVAGWLADDGRLFAHIFCHRERSAFSRGDVTGDHFFTGGMIPAQSLLPRFDRDLVLLDRWTVDGVHYQRTAEAWLDALDANAERAAAALASAPSDRPVDAQLAYWRLFFLITAESFGFNGGREWLVAHYLFGRRHG
jgi:cyclopropane-fatty-acyl-phospholipid synthase